MALSMNPVLLAQVRELSRQMKEARESGDEKRADILRDTIHIMNVNLQSRKLNE